MTAPSPVRHILWITDDQHRFDYYGRCGAVPGLRTPAADRLAGEGTVLSRAYSNCPVCMPTRFTWMHGLYASQGCAGLLGNAHDWPTGLPTLPGALQAAGFRTALIGKLHSHAGLDLRDLADTREQTRGYGFDHVVEVSGKMLAYWFDCDWTRHLASRGLLDTMRGRFPGLVECFEYAESVPSPLSREDSMDGFIGTKAREYLKELDFDSPTFTHVSFCGPHFPVDPPADYWEVVKDLEVPPPEGVDDPERITLWTQRRRAYIALIHQLDDEIAEILKVLEDRGALDDTLIVYGTDHGDLMGHKDRGHKGRPEDTSCRTPVTVRLPGLVAAGRDIDAVCGAVDLPATLLDAAGIDPSTALPGTPGRSLWPLLTGRTGTPPRATTFAESGKPGKGWRMVTDGEWKLVFQEEGAAEELYHLPSDPFEFDNRAADPDAAPVRDRLRLALVGHLAESLPPDRNPPAEVILDPLAARA